MTKSEVKKLTPQVGRPKADNPKASRFSIRLDADTEEKLAKYCEEQCVSKGEAIRRGIHLLLSEKKTKKK